MGGESAVTYARRIREESKDVRAASRSIRHDSAAVRSASRRTRTQAAQVRGRAEPYASVVGTCAGEPVSILVRQDGSVSGGDQRRFYDPLRATLAVARGCDRVTSISFQRAAWRPPVPPAEMAALWVVESSPTWSFLSMDESTDGDVHRVRLRGELDIASAADVEARLVEIAGSTVELDLSQLQFIDARGMAALVSARRRIADAGSDLRIVGATGSVRRVLSLVNLDGILDD